MGGADGYRPSTTRILTVTRNSKDMKKTLDIRDISIIDALPTYAVDKVLLNVGCGHGRIDRHISRLGWQVYATDHQTHAEWGDFEDEERPTTLLFSEANIFDLNTMPVKSASVVIASEVLEHLVDYKAALQNLLALTEVRLILTFPYRKSYDGKQTAPAPVGHCNWWSDGDDAAFKDVHEFEELCRPYSVSITKIRTKPEDVGMKQKDYIVVVDKRQKWDAQ